MGTDELSLNQAIDSDVLAPGSKLLSGQYEIIRYLSSGGFGITYLAKDSLKRTVVIKECFPEAFCSRVNKTVRARSQNYTDDFRSIVQMFIKEAHALSRLQHPSVVGVHQVFEDNETAYMALDLIDGQDLFDIIESDATAISPKALVEITLKLLDAVDHVHGQDLLHRDISPDNILLDKSGHPVLIDFGAAREEASRKSRVLSSVLVVKDGYSPPEFYVAGSPQRPCSDLYALAATLSHVITGEAPPNSQVRLAALASKEPDPYVALEGRFRQYDQPFLAAIDEAMKILPANRIQSAEEWMIKIDHSKRLEIARSKAQSDQSINKTVTDLVRLAQQEAVMVASKMHAVPDASSKQKKVTLAAVDSPPLVGPEGIDVPCAAEELIEVVSYEEAALPEPDYKSSRLDRIKAAKARVKRASTPIERVRSKEIERAAAKKKTEVQPSDVAEEKRQQLNRFASVPVVFCAYFFYASTAFQHDAVHAAAIEPLTTFGAEISEELLSFRAPEPEPEPEPEPKAIVIRRGLEG
ncbi:MAG: serine/threonine-protein kinase [Roseobacter sp.]